jgi:hypothetical protein
LACSSFSILSDELLFRYFGKLAADGLGHAFAISRIGLAAIADVADFDFFIGFSNRLSRIFTALFGTIEDGYVQITQGRSGQGS